MRHILTLLFILTCICNFAFAADGKKIIYIYSEMSCSDIFAVDNPAFNRDGCLDCLYQLKKEATRCGYEVKQTHTINSLGDFEYLLVFNVPQDKLRTLKQYPKEKLLLFLWEPPTVLPENYNPENHTQFASIYTWHDDLVDNKSYFKLYHPVLFSMIDETLPFDQKKLCTLIACNKWSGHPQELYSERQKVVQFYEANHSLDFDLYGKWWPETCKVYKGQIEKKVDSLKKYKFAFAYENIKGCPGYVTEKIFDCFRAGCVPIYLGASNIDAYIPKGCFINRDDFESDAALYTFLASMKEEEHQKYVQNIRAFLQSSEAARFSNEAFVQLVLTRISGL